MALASLPPGLIARNDLGSFLPTQPKQPLLPVWRNFFDFFCQNDRIFGPLFSAICNGAF
jgi:hypothetical protein